MSNEQRYDASKYDLSPADLLWLRKMTEEIATTPAATTRGDRRRLQLVQDKLFDNANELAILTRQTDVMRERYRCYEEIIDTLGGAYERKTVSCSRLAIALAAIVSSGTCLAVFAYCLKKLGLLIIQLHT